MAKYERQLRARANDLAMFICERLEKTGAKMIDSSNYHMAGVTAFFSVYCTTASTISVAVLGTGEMSTITAISASGISGCEELLTEIEELVDDFDGRKH